MSIREVIYCPLCGWESFDSNQYEEPCGQSDCDGRLTETREEEYEEQKMEIDLQKVKECMENKMNYNHAMDEEDCWSFTVLDALSELYDLEQKLRDVFNNEEK